MRVMQEGLDAGQSESFTAEAMDQQDTVPEGWERVLDERESNIEELLQD
jgi:hypothetical protein